MGITEGPSERAVRLYTGSFDHGSFRLQSKRFSVGTLKGCPTVDGKLPHDVLEILLP